MNSFPALRQPMAEGTNTRKESPMRTRTVAGVAATIIGAGGLAFAGVAPAHADGGKGAKCDFNLRINKVDSANGAPLAGAKFKITAPEDVC